MPADNLSGDLFSFSMKKLKQLERAKISLSDFLIGYQLAVREVKKHTPYKRSVDEIRERSVLQETRLTHYHIHAEKGWISSRVMFVFEVEYKHEPNLGGYRYFVEITFLYEDGEEPLVTVYDCKRENIR